MPYKFKCTTDNTFNAVKSKDTAKKQTDDIILRSVSLGISFFFLMGGAYFIWKYHDKN